MTAPGPEHTASAPCGSAIAYRVRHSARARRVRLAVSARDGLVVTLPSRTPEIRAREAVLSRSRWALDALDRVAERRELVLGGPEAQLPPLVELRACGRALRVEHAATAAGRAVARERGGVLVVNAPEDAGADVRLEALRRWRDRTARSVLPALLAEAADAHGLAPARVTVRGQRTRWGSCSSRGTVSLNRDLVFLPPHLVRYVVAHELCHLVHLDHSPRFWERMHALCPDTASHREELRAARDAYVPVWADA